MADEIIFLKAKAREGKHWPLMSSTLLEEAKVEMYGVCCNASGSDECSFGR